MKILIFGILLLSSQYLHANSCEDSDKGMSLSSNGKVIYSLTDPVCLKEGICNTQTFKEFDRCLSDVKVLKFSCDKNEMIEAELNCPKNTRCRDGKCVQIN